MGEEAGEQKKGLFPHSGGSVEPGHPPGQQFPGQPCQLFGREKGEAYGQGNPGMRDEMLHQIQQVFFPAGEGKAKRLN